MSYSYSFGVKNIYFYFMAAKLNKISGTAKHLLVIFSNYWCPVKL